MGLISTKLLAIVSIAIILFSTMPLQAQRRRSRRTQNKPPIVLRQTVTKECVSNEEIEGCSTNPIAPEPETGIPFNKARCSDCIIFGKQTNRPVPCYPAIAKAAKVSGEVKVHVIIDEAGKVIWARAESGHPLLRQAALSAACKTRFAPSTVLGQKLKVKVGGLQTYNFVLP